MLVNKMLMGKGSKSATIMFILDRPTNVQYKHHSYCYGKPMKILLLCLKELGIPMKDCYFTALVKVPTPDDRVPNKKEVKEYSDLLRSEIEIIDPNIVIPLDDNALKQTYGLTNIIKHRGKSVVKELYGRSRIIFPTINPELIFIQPKYTDFLSRDLENISKVWAKGSDSLQASDVHYHALETVPEIEEEIERLIRNAKVIVFDLETTGDNPFAEGSSIVCISLTDQDHYGVTIPLNHPQFKWSSDDFIRVEHLVRKIMECNVTKIAHNGKFDIKWLKYKYGIDVRNFLFDTMVCHYLTVSEEAAHGLKELAWEYTDMGGYDNPLDQFKQDHGIVGDYSQIDWDILKIYAAADADCTYRLYRALVPLLKKNSKWYEIFLYNLMPASYTFRDMEINGLKLDHSVVDLYKKVYPDRLQEIENKLRNYPEVVEIEREKRHLFALRQIEMKKPKEKRDKFIVNNYGKYKNFKFNFSSTNQIRELLFNKLKLTTPFLTKNGGKRRDRFVKQMTKNKKMSREGALNKFKPDISDLSTGKETMAYLSDKHPITKLIAEHKKLSKAYSAYVSPSYTWEGEDGLCHPEYLIANTVTGRLASEKPNAQNFTKPSENPYDFTYNYPIKRMFISRFGDEGVLLNMDYSQQELRVLGIVSGDENMVKAFMSGADIHKKTASTMFNKPMEDVTSHERRSAKAIDFGLIYGKSEKSLAKDMNMSLSEAKKFLQKWYTSYPKVKKWLDWDQDFVKQHGYIESITGRRRRLPGVNSTSWKVKSHCLREALNFPIQSASADITMKACNLINNQFKKLKLKSVLCMTVHDSIVSDVYLPEFDQVFHIMKQTMEHLPFKWLGNMPMKAEAEVGRNYADMVGIESADVVSQYKTIFDFIDQKLIEKRKIDKEKADKNIELKKQKVTAND